MNLSYKLDHGSCNFFFIPVSIYLQVLLMIFFFLLYELMNKKNRISDILEETNIKDHKFICRCLFSYWGQFLFLNQLYVKYWSNIV